MSTSSVLIELGWPAKALSPNARVHYYTLASAKKKAKHEAYWAMRSVYPGAWPKPERIPVCITAYPPTKRTRDKDNLLASLKASLDGIAQSLGIDDSLFDPRVQWGEPVPRGRVMVEIG